MSSDPSTMSLPAKYKPADHEPSVRAAWDAARAFHARPDRVRSGEKPPYCIFIPPPNVTARLHLGHALNNTVQDILARMHRMKGFEVLWMPGTDHAGIATQTVVEQRILKEEGKRRTDFARDDFIARVQAWKDEYEAAITDQLKAMGCSCDWDRQRFTMDEVCARAVREAFFRLFRDGLIYRGKRLVNWDPASQTALADDEVEMEEIDGAFYSLRYPLVRVTAGINASNPNLSLTARAPGVQHSPVTWSELAAAGYPGASSLPGDDPAWVTVATTRPETYLGDTAVAMNPKDPRASALEGLFCELPLVGRLIPIIRDEYVVMPVTKEQAEAAEQAGETVDPKARFATGFLKVTPAHDPNDYDMGQRHRLKTINVMAPDASISDKHGWTDVGDAHLFVGLSREAARKKVIDEFKARHVGNSIHPLFEKQVPYRHAVGHSYRTHVPIEPYLSDQWYCKVTDDTMKGSALRAMAADQRSHQGIKPSSHQGASGDGALTFFPERYARTFETWHENLRDWCISRQLWWGHRIPVWKVILGSSYTEYSKQFLDAGSVQTVTDVQNSLKKALDAQFSEVLSHMRKAGINTDSDIAYSLNASASLVFVCARTEQASSFLNDLVWACETEKNKQQPLPPIESASSPLTQRQRCLNIRKMGLVYELSQDPDVLDTWFSSALWPISTLGWPEPPQGMKGLLEAFNPSSVLATAREIITLWVSRMTMFNRYLLPAGHPDADGAFAGADTSGKGQGPVPFKHVYINPVVQDGHGQRMSKSLGNGVDPLDIIHSHGTDALRFVLAQTLTGTQDVRMPVDLVCPHCGEAFEPAWTKSPAGYTVAAPNQSCPACKKPSVSAFGVSSGSVKPSAQSPQARNSSTKFDAGRNFCTKLWNATRFALMNLDSAATGRADVASRELSLPDRWMLSRLARTIEQIDAAASQYQFSRYAELMYDLFWRDFCDWYLEAIKPTVKSSAAQQAVLVNVLDAILRLLHPITPYVTEVLWPVVSPMRRAAVQGLELSEPSAAGSGPLCLAGWPRVSAALADGAAEQAFERLQALVDTVRQVRSAKGVEPRRKVTLHADQVTAGLVRGWAGLVESLAGVESLSDEAAPSGPGSAAFLFEGRECALSSLADTADPAVERQRLTEALTKLDKDISVIESRLNNPGYASKAPPKLVQETKDQLSLKQSERDAIRTRLTQLVG